MMVFPVLYIESEKNRFKKFKFSIQCFYGVKERKKENLVHRSGLLTSYLS